MPWSMHEVCWTHLGKSFSGELEQVNWIHGFSCNFKTRTCTYLHTDGLLLVCSPFPLEKSSFFDFLNQTHGNCLLNHANQHVAQQVDWNKSSRKKGPKKCPACLSLAIAASTQLYFEMSSLGQWGSDFFWRTKKQSNWEDHVPGVFPLCNNNFKGHAGFHFTRKKRLSPVALCPAPSSPWPSQTTETLPNHRWYIADIRYCTLEVAKPVEIDHPLPVPVFTISETVSAWNKQLVLVRAFANQSNRANVARTCKDLQGIKV